jgi:hypothetical protein
MCQSPRDRRKDAPYHRSYGSQSITATDEVIEIAALVKPSNRSNVLPLLHVFQRLIMAAPSFGCSLDKQQTRLSGPNERRAHPFAKSDEHRPTQAARTDDRRCKRLDNPASANLGRTSSSSTCPTAHRSIHCHGCGIVCWHELGCGFYIPRQGHRGKAVLSPP